MLKKTLVSNNPMVYEKYNNKIDMIYSRDFTYLEVLSIARDKIHSGHELLTHPLSGSVKPNETPYKSVVIATEKDILNLQSLSIIEDSLDTAKKFIDKKKNPMLTQKLHEDFQLIDYYLIQNAIDSMEQF